MKTIVKQALRELEVDGDRRTAVAQFRFDEDLEVFEGHFPNNPLVPGIFLIEIARCVAERIADSTLDIVEVIDAKFTAQVGPRMTIVATVSLSENTQLSPDDVVSPADGMLRCDARLTTSDIDYISAHATSTPLGDRAEATAINGLFGPDGPPVASTKAMTGHECWMAGASESIYIMLMIRDGFLAPNRNFVEQEEEAPKINVLSELQGGEVRTILSNSFGFGGTNASLIFRAFPQ